MLLLPLVAALRLFFSSDLLDTLRGRWQRCECQFGNIPFRSIGFLSARRAIQDGIRLLGGALLKRQFTGAAAIPLAATLQAISRHGVHVLRVHGNRRAWRSQLNAGSAGRGLRTSEISARSVMGQPLTRQQSKTR